MKRILILQNELLYYRKELYNKLCKKYSITVLHSGKPSKTDDDLYNEIIVKKYKFGPFVIQRSVLKEATKNNYDGVIAMFDLRWIFNIIALYYPKSPKVLYWGHRYSNSNVVNILRNYLIRKSAGVVLYNDSEIEKMIKSGIKREKIFVAENTIHVSNHENCSHYEKDSFLYVGRAQKRKKIEELLLAFSQIVNQIPTNINIDIVGEGDENNNLQILAKELQISNKVIFHGAINDENKLKLLFKKAYAYVSPDAIGLGAQHSFAYGVPVITTSSGYKGAEYEKLKHNENSLLFNHPSELKEILLKLINDSEKRKRLGKNAYVLYSKKMTIELMAQGFVDAIENRL